MKHIFALILLLFAQFAYCPESQPDRRWADYYQHKINESRQIRLHRLFWAFVQVESAGYFLAFNEKENAGGLLQIRPVMIKEVNNIQDSLKFEISDRWRMERVRKIFEIVMLSKNPELDIIKACRIWNGLKSPEKYINQIKQNYYESNCY